MKSPTLQDTIFFNSTQQKFRHLSEVMQLTPFFSEELVKDDDVWMVVDPDNPETDHAGRIKCVSLSHAIEGWFEPDYYVYPLAVSVSVKEVL